MWNTKKESKQITCSEVRVPDIYIETMPRQKIEILLVSYPSQEWLAYLVGRQLEHGDFFVEDISVPPHKEATSVSAEAEPFHIPIHCIGVIHSHHRMGAFHSVTDTNYVDKNFPVSITVASNQGNLSYDAVSYQRTPCGKPIQLKCLVKYPEPRLLFDKGTFLKQARENIDKGKSIAVDNSLAYLEFMEHLNGEGWDTYHHPQLGVTSCAHKSARVKRKQSG